MLAGEREALISQLNHKPATEALSTEGNNERYFIQRLFAMKDDVLLRSIPVYTY